MRSYKQRFEHHFELPDGREASLRFFCQTTPGGWSYPPETECSDAEYFIDGVEAHEGEIEEFFTPEELQQMEESAKEVKLSDDEDIPDDRD